MSNPNEGTGSWKTIPPDSQVAYRSQPAQEWRRTGDSDDSMLSRMPLWARRFLGGLIALGLAAVIGLLLFSGGPGETPDADFRVIGISRYSNTGIPPYAFGHEDAEAFVNALGREGTGAFVNPHDATRYADNKDGRGLRLTLETFANSSSENSNLIVLLSLHGMVAKKEKDSPRALFLADNATPDSPFQAAAGEESPVIQLDEVLGSLKNSSATNLLLLIDAGRLGPNWRLGHLSNDLPALIKSEVEALGLQNLQVIVSTDVGETSWTMHQSRSSVFSHYLLEGLQGEADGWHTTKSDVIQHDKTKENRRISCSELASYLQHHVQNWANQHRGVTQSVVWFGSRPNAAKFNLIAIDAETEEKSKETADQPGEKTGEKAEEKTAATEKATPSDPDSDPAVTSKAGTSESSPSPTAHALKAAFDRLDKLWEARDTLRQAKRAALFGPRRWRALQTHLLRSERLLLCQLDAETELDEASRLVDDIKALVSGEPVLKLTPEKAHPLAKTRREAIRKLCKDAWKPDETSAAKPAAKPTEPAPAPAGTEPEPAAVEGKADISSHQKAIAALGDHLKEIRQNPQAARAARLEIANVLVEQITSSTQLSEQALRKYLPILELIGESDLPSELISLKPLADTAVRSRELGIRWDTDFAEPCCDAVKLRIDLEVFAAEYSHLLPWLGDDLDQALRHTAAVERWIEHGGKFNAGLHLKLARASKKKLDDNTDNENKLGPAVDLRATLMTEIPDFARWIANRIEDNPSRCQKAPLKRPARDLLEHLGRFPSLESSPLQEQDEKDLLKMVYGVRELNRLLDGPSRDAETLAELTGTYETLIVDYRAFRDSFDQRVESLNPDTLDAVAPTQWRQINLLLEVPWVSSTSRKKLRKRLLDVRSSTASSGGETRRRRELAGVWQAFWAIQALSLAVPSTPAEPANRDEAEGRPVDLKSLWTRWDEFVNADIAGEQQAEKKVMVARLRLGREINLAWRQIADDLSDPPPETTPDRDNQRALLARSLDGADATDTQREFNDSKFRDSRVSSTNRLLERRKEWTRSQHAPAWLKNWLPQSIDCALKTGPDKSFHEIPLEIPRQALDGKWTLAFESSSKIHTWLNGTKVTRTVSLTDEKTLAGYRIKLDDGGYSRKWLTIALLDEFQFPVAMDRIPVKPPFNPNEWRIVFLTDDEREEYLQDPRSARNELVTPQSGLSVSILHLPPSPYASAADSKDSKDKDAAKTEAPDPSVHELTPYLVRPKKDDSKSVVVTVFERINAKERREFLHHEFTLPPPPGTESLIKLDFKPAAKKPATTTDLSNGFIFELELRGDAKSNPVTFRVQPDFWHPRKLLRVIDLKFEEGRLSLQLGRRMLKDPLLPGSLDVQLRLPPELKAIAVEKSLEGKVGSQGETLFAEFDKAALEELRGPWPVSLNVAGFPRAFSWTLKHDLPPEKPLTVLRIIAPEEGPVFERDKPGRLVIDINSDDLDSLGNPWKLNTGWRIQYKFTPRNPQLPSPSGKIPKTFHLRYPVSKRFGFELTETGSWKIQGQVGDHHIDTADDKSFPKLPGRYSLRAVLESRFGKGVSRTASMEIGVETARTKPRVSITDALNRFVIGPDLEIRVKAEDPESGIRRLVAGFDLPPEDGMLSKAEVLATTRPLVGADILTTKDFTLTLPKSKLPKDAKDVGKKKLLVRATNGINIDSDHANRTIDFVQAKGSVKLEARGLGLKSRTLTLKGTGYFKQFKVGRSGDRTKNKPQLNSGVYTVTDVRTGWHKEITVKSREELPVTIDYTNPNNPRMLPPPGQ